MPDPRTPSDYETISAPIEAGGTDDGFNRRLGLGLVISIGANVLLLQGAGVLAKNMTLNAPANKDQAIVMRTIKQSEIQPSPTPTPLASATPVPTEKVAVKPTPRPRTPPTPRPERVRPTPRPRVVERTPPTPEPPQVVTATPKPTENAAKTTAVSVPVRSAETPRKSDATNNLAAKGSNNPAPAVANRASAAASTNFNPTIDVAPTPVIKDLPRQTLAGALKAAFSPSAGARSAASATNSASPEVETTNTSVTTSQAVTRPGRVSPGTQRVAVMVSTRPSASAETAFVLPTAGGTAKPGQAMKAQGNSASSNVAAISASNRTALATGGSGDLQAASVNAGTTSVAVTGAVGAFRPGHPFSRTIGQVPGDISRVAGTGGGTGVSLSSTAIGGTNRGGGTLTAASEGTSNANFGGGAGRGSGAGLAGNGTSLAADTSGGAGGGGFNGTSAKGGNGRGGKGIGAHAGSIGGGGAIGGTGTGEVGLSDGAVGGGGTGKGLRAGAITGGTADGIATSGHSGPVSNGTTVKAVNSGGGGNVATGGVKKVVTESSVGDKEAGRTFPATYRSPVQPSIPESLKAQTFDVTATVRANISATGQVRATLLKSSGYPALDDAAVSSVSNLRVTKPAYENGSPASDTHEFNFTFHNKG